MHFGLRFGMQYGTHFGLRFCLISLHPTHILVFWHSLFQFDPCLVAAVHVFESPAVGFSQTNPAIRPPQNPSRGIRWLYFITFGPLDGETVTYVPLTKPTIKSLLLRT